MRITRFTDFVRLFIAALLLALAVTISAPSFAVASIDRSPGVTDSKLEQRAARSIIVWFSSGVSRHAKMRLLKQSGSSEYRATGKRDVLVAEYSSERAAVRALRVLSSSKMVEGAERERIRYANRTPSTGTPARFGEQWGLVNDGAVLPPGLGVAGKAGTDIDAQAAWDEVTDTSNVIIAVVDSGVDFFHPDLSINVDRSLGRDFSDGDRNAMEVFNLHGTHVAGIIAAAGDQTIGVNWRARVMPVRVFGSTGGATSTGIADAFNWSANHGARVVNGSLGGPYSTTTEKQSISSHPNTLFVVSADNGGADSNVTPDYPCSYSLPNIICVAASNASDDRPSFSSWGGGVVDIAAPGNEILSTVPGGLLFARFDQNPVVAGVKVDADTTNDPTGEWVPGKRRGTTWAWNSDILDGTRVSELSDSAGTYPARNDSWITTPVIDVSGRYKCGVHFSLYSDLHATTGDYLRVEASSDGGKWRLLGSEIDGYRSEFVLRMIPKTMLTANTRIRFRLVTDAEGNGDGVYIDDVRVACADGKGPWKSDSAYGYESGTSMAAPHVTGVAALLFAKWPAASPVFVKKSILDGVDKFPAGIWNTAATPTPVASAGRLNAAGALAAARNLGDKPVEFNAVSPSRNSNVATTRPEFSWQPSGSSTGIDGYRVIVDGRQVANLTGRAAEPRVSGLVSFRLPGRYRLSVGYHAWRVVAYRGPFEREIDSIDFKVTEPPQITIAALKPKDATIMDCGKSPKKACVVRRSGAARSALVRLSGTISMVDRTNGRVISIRAYKRGANGRWIRSIGASATAFAFDGYWPDDDRFRVRLTTGKWRIRAYTFGDDLVLPGQSPWLHVNVR